MNQEGLELLTVEELKAKCKELGLKGYSKLEKEEVISLLLAQDAEEEVILLDALRTCKTVTRGEVLGKFEISKEDLEKDSKIQRFIEIGFIVEA
jgi:hypothetical protein